MTKYVVVVSNLPYTYYESVNIRGYPACHAVSDKDSSRTLCGKNPEDWSWIDLTLSDVNCKICKRIIEKDESKNNKRSKV